MEIAEDRQQGEGAKAAREKPEKRGGLLALQVAGCHHAASRMRTKRADGQRGESMTSPAAHRPSTARPLPRLWLSGIMS